MKNKEIIDNIIKNEATKDDVLSLLNIENGNNEFYYLLEVANRVSRTEYNNKGYVFSQIGLNAEPCSKNCKFCSMAESNYMIDSNFTKTMEDIDEIKQEVYELIGDGTTDLFLLTTEDYPVDEFIKIGAEIKKMLPKRILLVANIGDFDLNTAKKLVEAGFTGAYHVCRLREGIDTDIDPAIRIQTIENIISVGLELYYCVEPIGSEHIYDEITDEIIRAKDYNVNIMAVMRRTPVPGTPHGSIKTINALEFAKIAAITRLAVKPSRSMNAHEITPLTLIGGVNQLYAEVGSNPREYKHKTDVKVKYTAKRVVDLLLDNGYCVDNKYCK
ncbi:MAG: hypothetical protein LBC39_06980 [Methanobrevibacter sp.]|nr:hypothetical protein [Candidatus Methanovirga aequatorialis]